jgi:hypothetical protein
MSNGDYFHVKKKIWPLGILNGFGKNFLGTLGVDLKHVDN